MRIIKADNKHYIRLGDLDHLIRSMRFEVYDKYDRDDQGVFIQKDGTKGLAHDDAVTIAAYTHVMGQVLKNWIAARETAEEIREMRERIESEFYRDKYVVTTDSETEDGKKYLAFFRKFCQGPMEERYREEGKSEEEITKLMEDDIGMPVFSNLVRDAEYFEDHEDAEGTATHIRSRWDLEVKVVPAWHFDRRIKERLLKALDENPEGEA